MLHKHCNALYCAVCVPHIWLHIQYYVNRFQLLPASFCSVHIYVFFSLHHTRKNWTWYKVTSFYLYHTRIGGRMKPANEKLLDSHLQHSVTHNEKGWKHPERRSTGGLKESQNAVSRMNCTNYLLLECIKHHNIKLNMPPLSIQHRGHAEHAEHEASQTWSNISFLVSASNYYFIIMSETSKQLLCSRFAVALHLLPMLQSRIIIFF